MATPTGDGRPLRKILFTPNLNKSRYEDWLSSLKELEKKEVRDKVDDVIQSFKEDEINYEENSGKPLLYTTLRKLFDADVSLSREIYEAYAPIIVAMDRLPCF